MPGRRRPLADPKGFSLTETSIALAVLAIVVVLATPMFLTYYQASRLRVAAEEVAAFLNQGRQIGIKENVGVCVRMTATTLQFRLGGCSGTIWRGAGTDANGNVSLPDGVTLTATGDPVFTYLGAATPTATYTVRNTQTNATLRVFVSTSGRVSIGP